MNKTGVAFIILSIMLFLIGISILLITDKKEIKVDCFDKHNNIINDLVCSKTIYGNESLSNTLPLLFLFSFILFIMGLMEAMIYEE